MDEDKKKIILTVAEDQFTKYGFKKTNVDEIAKRLRISKKTIYKFFPTKKSLLSEIVNGIKEQISVQIAEILSSNKNAVEKFYSFGQLIGNRLRKITPEWLEDLKTFSPELWANIEQFRRENIQKNMNTLLNQGKEEGLIIDKPNVIILSILLSSVEGVMNPEFIINNNLSFQTALNLTLEILIAGILTKKGRRVFKQTKKGTV